MIICHPVVTGSVQGRPAQPILGSAYTIVHTTAATPSERPKEGTGPPDGLNHGCASSYWVRISSRTSARNKDDDGLAGQGRSRRRNERTDDGDCLRCGRCTLTLTAARETPRGGVRARKNALRKHVPHDLRDRSACKAGYPRDQTSVSFCSRCVCLLVGISCLMRKFCDLDRILRFLKCCP